MSVLKHHRPPRKTKSKQKNKNIQGALPNCNLLDIQPLTDTQRDTLQSYYEGQNLLLIGAAGTGKSFLSLYLAIKDVLEGNASRVIIVRSAVPSRDIGFLPGTLLEKTIVYEQPYREIVSDLLQRGDAYDILKKSGVISFITSSYVRGLTFDNSIIVIDEVQNFTDQEINSVLTRVGENSRVIICGDSKQEDLSEVKKKERSGFDNLLKTSRAMKCFDIIEFHIKDIVRSGFVKDYLIARMNLLD
jgi:phosphate starvation-inducible protein PhoH